MQAKSVFPAISFRFFLFSSMRVKAFAGTATETDCRLQPLSEGQNTSSPHRLLSPAQPAAPADGAHNSGETV